MSALNRVECVAVLVWPSDEQQALQFRANTVAARGKSLTSPRANHVELEHIGLPVLEPVRRDEVLPDKLYPLFPVGSVYPSHVLTYHSWVVGRTNKIFGLSLTLHQTYVQRFPTLAAKQRLSRQSVLLRQEDKANYAPSGVHWLSMHTCATSHRSQCILVWSYWGPFLTGISNHFCVGVSQICQTRLSSQNHRSAFSLMQSAWSLPRVSVP